MAARRLGCLVGGLGLAQFLLYVACSVLRNDAYLVLVYFDPRLGLYALLEALLGGSDAVAPTLVQWLSAVWQVGVGYGLWRGVVRPIVYLVGEAILVGPSVLFFVVVVVRNMEPHHAFSVGELGIPLAVLGIFTVWPVFWALRLLRAQLPVHR